MTAAWHCLYSKRASRPPMQDHLPVLVGEPVQASGGGTGAGKDPARRSTTDPDFAKTGLRGRLRVTASRTCCSRRCAACTVDVKMIMLCWALTSPASGIACKDHSAQAQADLASDAIGMLSRHRISRRLTTYLLTLAWCAASMMLEPHTWSSHVFTIVLALVLHVEWRRPCPCSRQCRTHVDPDRIIQVFKST